MYNEFFEFERKPFNVTPDPDFIFYSDQHKEALAHMLYGVRERRGFLLVTGRVGSGKTTLCRAFLRELDDGTSTALILNSNMGPSELIATIAEDFGVELPEDPSDKEVIDALNEFLLDAFERDRNACVVVDESQNLSAEALEQLRLLSNLETDKQKLLQIVLVGQPELENKLNRPELRQLKQRIAVRTYLSNLDEEESRQYVRHRIQLASRGSPTLSVDEAVFPKLYEASEGNPRAINLIGDRMLMAAFVEESRRVGLDHLESALDDLSERVNETEDRDSLIIRRLTAVADDGMNSFKNRLAGLLSSPVALVAVAALVTVLIGGLVVNNYIGNVSLPTIRGPSAETLNDYTESVDGSEEKTPTETDESSPDRLSDTGPRTPVPTPVDGAGTLPAVGETEPTPDTDIADADTSPPEATGDTVGADGADTSITAGTSAGETSDTAGSDAGDTDPPNRVEQPLVDQTEREDPPGSFGVETLEVEEGGTDVLTLTRNLSINRLISFYVAKNNVSVPDTLTLNQTTLSRSNLPGNRLRELLSLQTVQLEGGRDDLLGSGLPVLLRIGEDTDRYVLYLPERKGIWDPLRGWLERPTRLLPEEWNGSGVVLAQAPFDVNELMRSEQTGDRVRELQRLLNGTGRYDIPLVGNYGPMTRDRVGDFQEWQDLPRDGIGGPRTYLALLRENDRSIRFTDEQLERYLREVFPSDVPDQTGSGESRGADREDEEWRVF